MDFDRSVFLPAFAAAGMWIPIRVTSVDSPPVVTDTFARYSQPSVIKNSGNLSSEHEIKYQADKLPDLAEGQGVEFLDANGDPIAGKAFRVREPPIVTTDINDDQSGYFMLAILTSVGSIPTFEAREDSGFELRE